MWCIASHGRRRRAAAYTRVATLTYPAGTPLCLRCARTQEPPRPRVVTDAQLDAIIADVWRRAA